MKFYLIKTFIINKESVHKLLIIIILYNLIMKSTQKNTNKNEKSLYNITVKGSLGILAFGDIGLKAWRKIKQNMPKEEEK
jgi:hypothetical protein